MWTTLAVLAALHSAVAADASSLKISRVRLTYGPHGPVRPSASLLPGGNLVICFTIEGLTTTPAGAIEYSTILEILKDGKSLFKKEAMPERSVPSLGGNQVPATVSLDVGFESPPGDYTVRVTVNDLVGKQSQTFDQKVKVKEPDFGIVRISTTSDQEGRSPTAVPGYGEMLWVNFAAVNFARDPKGKQPDLAFEMHIFDDQGKPTTPTPFIGAVKGMVPEQARAVPGQFLIALNRPGKFRVVLKATCRLCKKTAEASFPLTVVAQQ